MPIQTFCLRLLLHYDSRLKTCNRNRIAYKAWNINYIEKVCQPRSRSDLWVLQKCELLFTEVKWFSQGHDNLFLRKGRNFDSFIHWLAVSSWYDMQPSCLKYIVNLVTEKWGEIQLFLRSTTFPILVSYKRHHIGDQHLNDYWNKDYCTMHN